MVLLNLNNNEIIIAFVRVANATRCIPSNEEEENKKEKEKKRKKSQKIGFREVSTTGSLAFMRIIYATIRHSSATFAANTIQ